MTRLKWMFPLVVGIFIGLMVAGSFVTAAPDPVPDSVTGKTWLEDRDRLRAQWLNGNMQALFNWANGNISDDNIATDAAIQNSKISYASPTYSSIPLSALNYTAGLRKEIHTSTAGQQLFTLTNSYRTGENRSECYINGIRQYTFTETSSMSITLDSPIPLAGWEVLFVLR